jgi:regulator of sirC expression with transglutaminase-like and TPR domain
MLSLVWPHHQGTKFHSQQPPFTIFNLHNSIYTAMLQQHTMRPLDVALADLNQALVLSPDDAVAFAMRGAVLHQLKRFDDALADLTKVPSSSLCGRGSAGWVVGFR